MKDIIRHSIYKTIFISATIFLLGMFFSPMQISANDQIFLNTENDDACKSIVNYLSDYSKNIIFPYEFKLINCTSEPEKNWAYGSGALIDTQTHEILPSEPIIILAIKSNNYWIAFVPQNESKGIF